MRSKASWAVFGAMFFLYSSHAIAESVLRVKYISFKGKGCELMEDRYIYNLTSLYLDIVSLKDRNHCTGCKSVEGDWALKDQPIVIPISELPETAEHRQFSFRFYAAHSTVRAHHYRTHFYLTKGFATQVAESGTLRKEFETFRDSSDRRATEIKTPCTLRLEFSQADE